MTLANDLSHEDIMEAIVVERFESHRNTVVTKGICTNKGVSSVPLLLDCKMIVCFELTSPVEFSKFRM